MKEAEVLIQFDLINMTDLQREKLEKIESLFHDMGIRFDTGCGFGGRDWEWDWSLKGPVKVYFKKIKRIKKNEKKDRLCN